MAPSSEARSVDTVDRQRDALEIFEDYGISRPEGWLSEEDAVDDHDCHRPRKKMQVCHSCGEQMKAQRYCGNCGHEACLKCLGEVTGRSPCVHQHEHGQRAVPRHRASPAKHQKTHRRHGSRHSHRHRSRSPDAGASTPRPPKLVVDSSIVEEEELPQLERKASTKTGFEGSGLVKDNPFFRSDRFTKVGVTTPQTSTRNARAHRPTQYSDYVPSRRMEASSQNVGDHGDGSNPDCEATHSEHRAHRPDNDHGKVRKRRETDSDKENVDADFASHSRAHLHSEMADSLESKVDQLYHHAQDMHHSQHILEHLAAGSRSLREERKASVPTTNRPVISAKHHSYADLRLHSLTRDERADVPYPSGLHGIMSDTRASVYEPPVHNTDSDEVLQTGRDTVVHDLSEDEDIPLSPPKTHDLSQDVLSKVEGWRKFHSGVNMDSAKESSGRLKPASPKSWMDRPAKIPRPNEVMRTLEDSQYRGSQSVSTVFRQRQSSVQLKGSHAIEDQHRLAAQSEPDCAPWPCLEDTEPASHRRSSAVVQGAP